MKHRIYPAAALAAMLLTACGGESSQAMQFIKSVETYDTLSDMYQNPDSYLGKQYHIVGTLYPSTDANGEKFYSVYAEDSHGDDGIGLELDWSDFSGFADYDKITVEGTLDKEKETHDGASVEYLILRCTTVEKRAEKT